MKTLSDILEFAKANNACMAQLDKFISFIESGDELSAWQTVLGNINWLRGNCLDIDQTYLESNAKGIGKMWHPNGQLFIEETYKDDKLNGLCRSWYSDGQLYIEYTYNDGKLNGLYRRWHPNGQLWIEETYKNGKRIS